MQSLEASKHESHLIQPLEHHPLRDTGLPHSVLCPLTTGITLYPHTSRCSHCPNSDRHPLRLDRDLYRGEPVLVDETAAGNTWNISPNLVSMLNWLQS